MTPAAGAEVEIAVIYPELLSAPGDAGNAEVLVRRLAWRGFRPRLTLLDHDQPITAGAVLYLLGGAEGPAQVTAARLLTADQTLGRAVAGGAVLFATGGGFQLAGHSFPAPDGSALPGLGLVDVETVAGTPRVRGEVLGRLRDLSPGASRRDDADSQRIDPVQAASDPRVITGVEDHAGRTHLGPAADPLAMISLGFGNCGDGTEGAITHTAIGTNLHGPVLARNPGLADQLLSLAVGRTVRHTVRADVEELRRRHIVSAMRTAN